MVIDKALHFIHLTAASVWLFERSSQSTDLNTVVSQLGDFGGFAFGATAVGWASLICSGLGKEDRNLDILLLFLHTVVAYAIVTSHAHHDFWVILSSDPHSVAATLGVAFASTMRLLLLVGDLFARRLVQPKERKNVKSDFGTD